MSEKWNSFISITILTQHVTTAYNVELKNSSLKFAWSSADFISANNFRKCAYNVPILCIIKKISQNMV